MHVLLEESEERLLAWRVCHRRKEPKDLVHVQERPEARRSLLHPHPADNFVEEICDEKHPLRIRQVRDGENGNPRLSSGCIQDVGD